MCLCVLVCVNFGDEIFVKGENVKPEKIRKFKKWQNDNNYNNKLLEMVQGSLKNFLDL